MGSYLVDHMCCFCCRHSVDLYRDLMVHQDLLVLVVTKELVGMPEIMDLLDPLELL